ncbi:hypothetical protein E1301_Tti021158 [Triplophysa tibetana]|uniref:Ig-like domain-containing protein n=1 Tax=Triplophysa tibetana TaxID=1572043 RepID=A0A5A9NQY4_9TELE|nr:hypothetical protein E1301_Tti021158 [Triplophysa tibetana]
MAKKLVPHQPPFLPRNWLRIGIPSITKQAPPGGWLGRTAFPLRPGYHVGLHLAVNYSVRMFHAFSSKDETIPISTIFLPTVMNVSHVSLSWYKEKSLLSSISVCEHRNINISLHLECLDDSYTCVVNNPITNKTQHLNTDVCHKCSGKSLLSSISVSEHSNINISLHLECLDDSYTCVINNPNTNQTQHLNTDDCHKCSAILLGVLPPREACPRVCPEMLILNKCYITDVTALADTLAQTQALEFLKELDLSYKNISGLKKLRGVLKSSNCELSSQLLTKMKRKKDIMSFFQRKDKVDSETEPNGSGVERARESREPAEREQEELSIGETESEGILEEESETDGETEAESNTPTEEPRVSTSSGPSGLCC